MIFLVFLVFMNVLDGVFRKDEHSRKSQLKILNTKKNEKDHNALVLNGDNGHPLA